MRLYLILAICGAADQLRQSSAAALSAMEFEESTGAAIAAIAAQSVPIDPASSSDADVIGEELISGQVISTEVVGGGLVSTVELVEEVGEDMVADEYSAAQSTAAEVSRPGTPVAVVSAEEKSLAATPHALKKQVYSNEGDDYPGADAGVLVALPQRLVGSLEPYEGNEKTLPASDESEVGDADEEVISASWPKPSALFPFYEWSIAQARGNRYALPEPSVQLLEQLEKTLSDFEQGLIREVTVERRQLQIDGLLNALGSTANGAGLLNSGDGSNLAFNAHQFPTLVNAISGSVSNVVQAAGEAVGVTTTTAAPVNQAVLAMLSILQGFQQLAVAAGSMGANMRPIE